MRCSWVDNEPEMGWCPVSSGCQDDKEISLDQGHKEQMKLILRLKMFKNTCVKSIKAFISHSYSWLLMETTDFCRDLKLQARVRQLGQPAVFTFISIWANARMKTLTFEDWSSKDFLLGSTTDCSWTYVHVRVLPMIWRDKDRDTNCYRWSLPYLSVYTTVCMKRQGYK